MADTWFGLKDESPVLSVKSVAVMSDVHLGAGEVDKTPGKCVLDEPGQLKRFSDFLRDRVGPVDALIFNGDLFDFALATMHETMTSGRAFLDVASKYASQLIYVPGNHDHHTWLLANEIHELAGGMPTVDVDAVQRTERMYHSTYLQRMIASQNCQVFIGYPNVYWKPAAIASTHTYVFHHGHYCEDTYSLISDLLVSAFPDKVSAQQQQSLEFLEAVNFGWIELVWYQLGQMGKGIGAHGLVESLYQQIQAGQTQQFEDALRRLYQNKFKAIVDQSLRAKLGSVAGAAASAAADHALPAIIIELIRLHAKDQEGAGASAARGSDLDGDLAKLCVQYISKSRGPYLPSTDKVGFFFGHTHVAGHLNVPDASATLYNDGGWIRDTDASWSDSHVLAIDGTGSVTDHFFAETNDGHTSTPLGIA
ncbi:MAG TPA: metallophosphoesterase [Kofleriaceae bacterium]|jgi:hypothetical protein